MILRRKIGIGAGALTDNDVANFNIGVDRARRADAHDVLYAVNSIQFVRIYTYGRHTHAACHNGDFYAVVSSRVTVNTANVVDKFCVL